MSFSVAFSKSEIVLQESASQWARWTRSASIIEAKATSSGRVNLTASVQTYSCYSSNNYSWPFNDRITCSGQSESPKAIHAQYYVPGGITYTETFDVPVSWIGKSVQISIAGFTTTTTFNATEVTPSTITASNGTFGSAIPITLTPSVSGVKHTLTVTCANRVTTLLTQDQATSANWTPALETYAPLITSATSATAVISCTTYNGGVQIGNPQEEQITVSFPANSLQPTTTSGWVSVAPLNEGAVSEMTVYVQGYSKAQVTFDASKISTQYSATISGYSITCNGVTDSSSPYNTGILPDTSASILCTVTDSRGQTASETLTISPISYREPWLTSVSIFRCDENGVASESGSHASVRVTGNYTHLINTSQVDENRITLYAYVREASGQYGTPTGITSGQAEILHGIDPDTSYVIKVTGTDELGNAVSVEQSLPTQVWAMKFRPSGVGVGFGKAPEADKAIEIPSDWTLKIGQQDLITIISNKCKSDMLEYVYPVGSIYMSVSSTSPQTFLGGTWERIQDTFLLAAGTTYAAASTGGAATVTLDTTQIPSHTHAFSNGGTAIVTNANPQSYLYNGGFGVGDLFANEVKNRSAIASTGGSQAHENMPPYLTVYVWKRTA